MKNNNEQKKGARRSFNEGGKMHYVYLLKSKKYTKQTYVGLTDNLISRFKDHNAGKSPYTSKFRPWKLICYFAFRNKTTAKNFEEYLKTGSGRAFSNKHFKN